MNELRTIVGSLGACCFCNRADEASGALLGLNDEFEFARSAYKYRYAVETCYCFRVIVEGSSNVPRICRRCASRLEDSWAFFAQIRTAQAELKNEASCSRYAMSEIKAERLEVEVDFNFESEDSSPEPAEIVKIEKSNKCDFEKFNCDRCTQVFKSEILLEHHLMTHDDVQAKCQLCTQAFAKLSHLRQHWKKDHHAKIIYLCNSCPETFPTSIDAMRHQENQHEDRTVPRFKGHEINRIINGQETPMKMCDSCGETVSEDSQLFQHVQTHRPKHICHTCGKEFKAAGNLRSHLQSHTDQKLACDVCGKVYKNAQTLKEHRQKHDNTDRLPYICPKCPDMRFKHIFQRRKHLVEVHDEAPKLFICKHCGMDFKYQNAMRFHVNKVHLQRVPHMCTECDYSTMTRSRLVRHMKAHSDVKSYKCDVCGKSFRWEDNLRQHMKIHNNIMDFECEHCGMKFVQKISLVLHMKKHQ